MRDKEWGSVYGHFHVGVDYLAEQMGIIHNFGLLVFGHAQGDK